MTSVAFLDLSLPSLGARVSRARLQRMFSAHYTLVWRVVRRLGVPEDAADDAAQQVFLVATERLADIQEGSERAFLYGTALRVARSVRRNVNREPAVDTADLLACSAPFPDELADSGRARKMLDQVLDLLPEEQRTILVLHEFEALTMREISEVLEIPTGTVASRLRRARETFRSRVQALLDPRGAS